MRLAGLSDLINCSKSGESRGTDAAVSHHFGNDASVERWPFAAAGEGAMTACVIV